LLRLFNIVSKYKNRKKRIVKDFCIKIKLEIAERIIKLRERIFFESINVFSLRL
jgi:hypothetical protein